MQEKINKYLDRVARGCSKLNERAVTRSVQSHFKIDSEKLAEEAVAKWKEKHPEVE